MITSALKSLLEKWPPFSTAPKSFTLTSARLSSAGGREENQDAQGEIQLPDKTQLYVVADGLGGHGGGAVASAIAVQHILTHAPTNFTFTPEGLDHLKEGAHQAIKQEQIRNTKLERMRTTLVILAIRQQHALWLHCGDARLYHFRGDQILSQTRDHSVPQMLVSSGDIPAEEIRHHPDRNRVLRALGGDANEAKAAIQKTPVPLQPGDHFLLCTDGFWDWVLETEMQQTLKQNGIPNVWLQTMEKILLARAHGEFDNYTAQAIAIG